MPDLTGQVVVDAFLDWCFMHGWNLAIPPQVVQELKDRVDAALLDAMTRPKSEPRRSMEARGR